MGMYMYDSITKPGDFNKRYQTYTLANEGTDNDYPGEWWSRVYPWGGTDFLTEWEAFEFLEKEYPGRSHLVQEVYWVAEPNRIIQRLKPAEERAAIYAKDQAAWKAKKAAEANVEH